MTWVEYQVEWDSDIISHRARVDDRQSRLSSYPHIPVAILAACTWCMIGARSEPRLDNRVTLHDRLRWTLGSPGDNIGGDPSARRPTTVSMNECVGVIILEKAE